jgi:hypothetical protein
VKSITEAATTKIGFFRDNIKQSMKTLGRIWLSNLQQFSDDPAEIRRTVDGREIPDVVVPSDYQGEMDLDIDDDSMVPLSKQEKREMHQSFLADLKMTQDLAINQMTIFKQPSDIPRYNFHEINEDTARLYSRKDFERYVLDSNIQIPQEQQPDNTKEYLNFSYKDAPPDVKAQIEAMYGLNPSAMHDTDLTSQAIQAGKMNAEAMNPQIGMQDGTTGPGANNAPQPA